LLEALEDDFNTEEIIFNKYLKVHAEVHESSPKKKARVAVREEVDTSVKEVLEKEISAINAEIGELEKTILQHTSTGTSIGPDYSHKNLDKGIVVQEMDTALDQDQPTLVTVSKAAGQRRSQPQVEVGVSKAMKAADQN
jgi:hypothetical protein